MIDDHLAAHRQYERIKRESGEAEADKAAKRHGWRLPQEREAPKPLTRCALRSAIYRLLTKQPGIVQGRITTHFGFVGIPKFRVVREIKHLAKVGRVRIDIEGRSHHHYALAPSPKRAADSAPSKRSNRKRSNRKR